MQRKGKLNKYKNKSQIVLANTDNGCDLLHNRPVLSTNKTATVFTTAKMWL